MSKAANKLALAPANAASTTVPDVPRRHEFATPPRMSPCPNLPRSMLLIVQRPEGNANASQHVEDLLAALDCRQLDRSIYALPTDAERDARLRRFAKECAAAGASVWLFAQLDDSAQDDKKYRPLRDRSEHYAKPLMAWREGHGPLPELNPGELLRL